MLKKQNLSHTFLKPKDLYTLRVNGLIDLVANTRLGIVHYSNLKQRGDIMELLRLHVIRVHNGTSHFFLTPIPATTDYDVNHL
jgi:hypothetical protein